MSPCVVRHTMISCLSRVYHHGYPGGLTAGNGAKVTFCVDIWGVHQASPSLLFIHTGKGACIRRGGSILLQYGACNTSYARYTLNMFICIDDMRSTSDIIAPKCAVKVIVRAVLGIQRERVRRSSVPRFQAAWRRKGGWVARGRSCCWTQRCGVPEVAAVAGRSGEWVGRNACLCLHSRALVR
jgi:hypothetical protein